MAALGTKVLHWRQMTTKTPSSGASAGETRLPAGLVLKPPVKMRELADDVDHDPAEAEALVAVIRHMRREGTEPGVDK